MFQEVLPLRHASRELIRELGFLEDWVEPGGLTHSQCHALIELESRGPTSQVDLAAVLRLDKSRTSRVVDELVMQGWSKREAGKNARTHSVALTAKGKNRLAEVHRDVNARVERALATLDDVGRRTVLTGMSLYARALTQSRRRAEYDIRPVKKSDCAAVARLIRTVMPQFGASGPGYAIMDPEVDDMYGSYNAHKKRAAYWVIVRVATGDIVGAGGFAPLVGGDKGTCELRKMYTYGEIRGLGLGSALLGKCTHAAAGAGFTRMYLETLDNMTQARALYEKYGFQRLRGPLGDTGHSRCDRFYARELKKASS
jgi:putative acetyltransferase